MTSSSSHITLSTLYEKRALHLFVSLPKASECAIPDAKDTGNSPRVNLDAVPERRDSPIRVMEFHRHVPKDDDSGVA